MTRRDVLALLGGMAAVAWPRGAIRAQQGERVLHLGVLMNTREGEVKSKNALATFTQALGQAGWMRTLRRYVRTDHK